MASLDPAVPQQKMFERINLKDQGQKSVNEPGTHGFIYTLTQIFVSSFSSITSIWFLNIFLYKGIMNEIWPCCKVGQGQHIIIWTNSLMYNKFEGHRPSAFGEDFWWVCTICGHGYMTKTIWASIRSPILLRLHMKFGLLWFSVWSLVSIIFQEWKGAESHYFFQEWTDTRTFSYT